MDKEVALGRLAPAQERPVFKQDYRVETETFQELWALHQVPAFQKEVHLWVFRHPHQNQHLAAGVEFQAFPMVNQECLNLHPLAVTVD